MMGRSMRIWLTASVVLLGAQTRLPPHEYLEKPLLIWAVHVPNLANQYTASTLTPAEDITVTRVQAQTEVPGQNCSANPVITVSNGTVSVPLSITTLANDTGPVNTSFVAGIPITVSVGSPAACLFPPVWANVVVQYKSQDR